MLLMGCHTDTHSKALASNTSVMWPHSLPVKIVYKIRMEEAPSPPCCCLLAPVHGKVEADLLTWMVHELVWVGMYHNLQTLTLQNITNNNNALKNTHTTTLTHFSPFEFNMSKLNFLSLSVATFLGEKESTTLEIRL